MKETSHKFIMQHDSACIACSRRMMLRKNDYLCKMLFVTLENKDRIWTWFVCFIGFEWRVRHDAADTVVILLSQTNKQMDRKHTVRYMQTHHPLCGLLPPRECHTYYADTIHNTSHTTRPLCSSRSYKVSVPRNPSYFSHQLFMSCWRIFRGYFRTLVRNLLIS